MRKLLWRVVAAFQHWNYCRRERRQFRVDYFDAFNRISAALFGIRETVERASAVSDLIGRRTAGMSVGGCDAIIVVDRDKSSLVIATDKIVMVRFSSDSHAEIYLNGQDFFVTVPLQDNPGLARNLGRKIFDFRQKELRGRDGLA